MTPEETRWRHLDDGTLVRRARGGCRQAADELVRRYRAGVSLTARQIVGDAGRAEDVAQDALLIALHALPTLADPDRFGAWLAAITRHRARRMARQEGRYVPLEPAHLEALRSPVAPPSHGPAGDLADAVAGLGAEYRAVLHLRYGEEWPVAQIAAFLSLPLTTVKWRLHYAREMLRRRLTRPTET